MSLPLIRAQQLNMNVHLQHWSCFDACGHSFQVFVMWLIMLRSRASFVAKTQVDWMRSAQHVSELGLALGPNPWRLPLWEQMAS